MNSVLVVHLVLGILVAACAALFVWFRLGRRITLYVLSLQILVGIVLIVGLISIAFPQVWGNGYSVVDAILHQRLFGWLLLAVLLAKVASTASTVGSGAIGGVFGDLPEVGIHHRFTADEDQ